MAELHYDEAAAERLEAVYLGPDVAAQRDDTLRRLALKAGESVLDIGSGPGFLAAAIADAVGPRGRVRGIDVSAAMVSRATARNARPWLSFACGDAADLAEPDAHYDVVVSTQVAEYVADTACFCREFHRVMRPGGRGLVLATDWRSVAWHASDRERMARVLAAFEPHCAHQSLPRTLAPRLRDAGLTVDDVDAFTIINLDWRDGCYSERMIPLIAAYVAERGTVPGPELDAWAADLAELNSRGEHFFATTRLVFAVSRPG
jgi:SAM-dependent methyltransferase